MSTVTTVNFNYKICVMDGRKLRSCLYIYQWGWEQKCIMFWNYCYLCRKRITWSQYKVDCWATRIHRAWRRSSAIELSGWGGPWIVSYSLVPSKWTRPSTQCSAEWRYSYNLGCLSSWLWCLCVHSNIEEYWGSGTDSGQGHYCLQQVGS
jgi:hypothetical protein